MSLSINLAKIDIMSSESRFLSVSTWSIVSFLKSVYIFIDLSNNYGLNLFVTYSNISNVGVYSCVADYELLNNNSTYYWYFKDSKTLMFNSSTENISLRTFWLILLSPLNIASFKLMIDE